MVRRLPNLNAVKAFDAAARHGSFVRAAEELSVTHSAISRQVRALEEELGVALFERRHRQVVLTSVGARYAKAVEAALLSISLDTGNLRKPDRRTRLVIDVDSDLNALWLLPQIQQSWFAKTDSDIELDIRSHPEPPRSISHEADLAITWGPVEMPGFEREAFLDFTCFPVCSPDLAVELDLRDIASVQLLHDRTSNWWEETLGRWGTSPRTAGGHLFFHRTYLCMDAAARGMGLAIGDEVSSAEMLQSGRLISPCGPVLPGRVSYYLLYPRTRPLPASIRILLEWLRARRDAHNEWAQRWRPAHLPCS